MLRNLIARPELLESRRLLTGFSCLELEMIDWGRTVTAGVAETYELRVTNLDTRELAVNASASNFFGGIDSLEQAGFGLFENSVIPADYDGSLSPEEEVTFTFRATPQIPNPPIADSLQAVAEVLISVEADFLTESIIGDIRTPSADATQDGVVNFEDFLILSQNFGNEVDGVFAGDFDLNGSVEFQDFLILSAQFGQTVA